VIFSRYHHPLSRQGPEGSLRYFRQIPFNQTHSLEGESDGTDRLVREALQKIFCRNEASENGNYLVKTLAMRPICQYDVLEVLTRRKPNFHVNLQHYFNTTATSGCGRQASLRAWFHTTTISYSSSNQSQLPLAILYHSNLEFSRIQGGHRVGSIAHASPTRYHGE
jgi:hypothetical protein